jgi:hypothetical protein
MLDTVTTNVTVRTHGLPDEMGLLLERYPRDSWQAHPGFAVMNGYTALGIPVTETVG